MALTLRTRAFAWLLPRIPGGTVAGSDLEAIAAMQARGVPDTPVTRLVMGRPLPSVEIGHTSIPAPHETLAVRTYRPRDVRGPLPIVVNLHGGGWVRRDMEVSDWSLSRVARGARALVLSVDYRLAPTHPFPAAVDDAIAATRWIGEHGGDLDGDPSRMAVMGDSAGANLAAVTAIALRDGGGPTLRHQVLAYPPTDLTGGSPSLTAHPSPPILSRDAQQRFRELYLGDADPADPRVSPLMTSDLRDLPPALIIVGDHDPLRDDAHRYAAALRAAGVPVRETIYLDAVHGFLSFPGVVPAAKQAIWEIATELRNALYA